MALIQLKERITLEHLKSLKEQLYHNRQVMHMELKVMNNTLET